MVACGHAIIVQLCILIGPRGAMGDAGLRALRMPLSVAAPATVARSRYRACTPAPLTPDFQHALPLLCSCSLVRCLQPLQLRLPNAVPWLLERRSPFESVSLAPFLVQSEGDRRDGEGKS